MKKKLLWVLVLLLAGSSLAFAQVDAESNDGLAIDTIWVLFAAVLVFFMQAGFGLMYARHRLTSEGGGRGGI